MYFFIINSSYREISLINTITKIFTRILSERIPTWSGNKNIIPECQWGFRRNQGCIDNLYVLSATVGNGLRLKKWKVYCAFVDFKEAFDTVDHKLLYNKLYHLGLCSKK